jgi:hypothetical protein
MSTDGLGQLAKRSLPGQVLLFNPVQDRPVFEDVMRG